MADGVCPSYHQPAAESQEIAYLAASTSRNRSNDAPLKIKKE
jgi:hypothetical protein